MLSSNIRPVFLTNSCDPFSCVPFANLDILSEPVDLIKGKEKVLSSFKSASKVVSLDWSKLFSSKLC